MRSSGALFAAAVARLTGKDAIAACMNGDMSKDVSILNLAARLAADETMHHTVLTQALGRPLPNGALSFGA